MNKITMLAMLTASVVLASSSVASAQTSDAKPIFIDINGGVQTQARTIESSTSFPLYSETAVINAAQSIDSGGLFDLSAGYRFLTSFGAAVGFSRFSKSGDGSIAASIPSPNAFNRSVTVTSTATDLKHSEIGTHLMLVYFAPVTVKIDVNAFIGPSFFRVKQDILSASVPTGTQTANIATQEEKANATGINAGINVNYMFQPNYGAGIFLRYAGATVDLPSAPDVKVGGFQVGVGLRLRF
jgi:outer membrane protein with beta-barrel domain